MGDSDPVQRKSKRKGMTAAGALARMAAGEIVTSATGHEYKRDGDVYFVRWPSSFVPAHVDPPWVECDSSLAEMPFDSFWGG
jgi:hypothetical protein